MSCELALNFDQGKMFSKKYKPMRGILSGILPLMKKYVY